MTAAGTADVLNIECRYASRRLKTDSLIEYARNQLIFSRVCCIIIWLNASVVKWI